MDGTLPPELQEDHTVPIDRARNYFAVEWARPLAVLPKLLVSFGIEGGQSIFARDKNIFLAMMFDEKRRGVTGSNGPVQLPSELACSLVEAD